MLNPQHRDRLRFMAGFPPGVPAPGAPCERSYISIDRTPIRHRAYKRCEQSIASMHLRSVEEGIGGCGLLVGPSGVGKTLLQKSYQAECELGRDDPDSMPIIRAVIPSKPTVKSVVTEMLHAANHPCYAAKESESLKTIRLMELLRDLGTEVVFLDEMTNVPDQAAVNVEHELTDWLKNFIDEFGRLVVLVGLDRIANLLRRNNQLRRRISGKLVMTPLSRGTAENWTEFRDIMRELHSRTPIQAIRFDEQILARRFYFASAGLMDYLVRMVNFAATLASLNDESINVSFLAEAFVQVVWPDCPSGLNPFLMRDPDELRLLTEPGEPFADWGLQ